MNNRSVFTDVDALVLNKLVKVWGKCAGATPASGKVTLFTITDGYTTPLRVKVGTSQYVGTAAQVNGQFAVIVGTIKSDVDGRFIQLVSSSLDKLEPFTITSSVVGGNGTISPTPSATVLKGANQTFTFNAAADYVPDQVTIDGGTPVPAGASYTFINVQANHTISVTFKLAPVSFTITSSVAGGNGTISPTPSVSVPQGANQTFDFLAASGYVPDQVTIDGGTPVPAGASYTFINVQAIHSISVTFKLAPVSFTITSSVVGGNGTISPTPSVSVFKGSNQTFNFLPAAGYVPDQYTIDSGTPVPAGASYTFINVQAIHSISVTFKVITRDDIPQQGDLLFSAITEMLPAGPNIPAWPTFKPDGLPALTQHGGMPTLMTINGVNWEWNRRSTSAGFRLQRYEDPIPVNGATIVVAVRPVRNTIGDSWDSVVDIFYQRLVLCVRNDNGAVGVWRNNNYQGGPSIPNGQITVLSLVVQPTGEYKVFANGVQIMDITSTSDMTSLAPNMQTNGAGWGSNPDFTHYIDVGRNDPDGWPTFNGNIGDVMVWKVALDDATRAALETALTAKFGTAAMFTITASAGAGGAINPVGDVVVAEGNDQTFAIKANFGYRILDVLVDGVTNPGAIAAGSYTFTNVVAGHTIAASFETVPTTATRYEAENAVLSGLCNIVVDFNASGGMRVAKNNQGGIGDLITFTVPVATGGMYNMVMGSYLQTRATYIRVNGVNLPAPISNTGTPDSFGYVRNTVPVALNAGDNTIVLYNNLDWGPHWDYIDIPFDPSGPSNKITSSAGAGGSISPLGDVYCAPGAGVPFLITPESFFDVTSVLTSTVGEVLAGNATQTYSMTNVTVADTIHAGFTTWVDTQIIGKVTTDGTTGEGGVLITATGPRGPFTDTTASDGTYSIRVRPGDTYTLTAKKSKYSMAPPSLSAGPGDLTGKDFVATYVGLTQLVVLDASVLAIGDNLASWPNTGTLGGSFDKYAGGTGPNVVADIGGKQAVEFIQLTQDAAGRRTMASNITGPAEICGNSDWTISTDLYRPAGAVGGDSAYCQWAGGAYLNYQSAIFGYNEGQYAYTHWGNDTWWATRPSANAWHNVTITYDGAGTEIIYVDGVVDRTNTGRTLSINPGGMMMVGGRTWHDARNEDQYWRYNGAIAKLVIWDQALTGAEVRELNGLVTYTINASVSGGHGSISPSGAVSVLPGGSQQFDFTAAPGYVPDQVTINGGAPEAAGASYTFTDVQANGSISVTFKLAPTTVTITASAGAGGSISPTGAVSVPFGGSQKFDFTPDPGYMADQMTIDGGTPVPAGASYTFEDVQTDHTIDVTFVQAVNISGTVTDIVTALPAGSVQLNVHVVGGSGTFDYPVTTLPNGTYSVDVIWLQSDYSIDVVDPQTPGVVMLTPLADRSVTGSLGLDDLVWPLDVAVNPPVVTGMSGIVKDSATNLPIANAVVQVGGKEGAAVVTNDAGAYSFTGLSTYGDLYADAVGYAGRLFWVTGAGNLGCDILLTAAVEPYSYNGDMEDLVNPSPAQWEETPGSTPTGCVDWSASTDARRGTKSLFYAMNDTATSASNYSGIHKIIQLAPAEENYEYNFFFTAKADTEVITWQPLIEFMDAAGDNWDGFVSNEAAPHREYSHTPYYEWHTYLNWFDRGNTRAGAPVRWKPTPLQTEVHYIFLYETLPSVNGKGCYIDDLMLDAVPQNMTYEVVAGT